MRWNEVSFMNEPMYDLIYETWIYRHIINTEYFPIATIAIVAIGTYIVIRKPFENKKR